ncbi:MAG TPA: beta-galactosidase [Armatimonadota bacterium]|nr:beta-galactosidase [Armatimonadota bacterium]
MQKLYYGAAYYPELWPEAVIAEDMRYMQKAGINCVRMWEFAWAAMEPHEGEISLDFFVAIINRLHAAGIGTVFCTPTPTPPIWLSHGHPERMYTDNRGYPMAHGARQHVCTNNPYLRERGRLIVEACARAVGRLPGVIGWQTDNEFKCHVGECCCAECVRQWHEWLEARYGTVARLNDAWGTAVWSEAYERFDQVPAPMATTMGHNAALQTMYRLFHREKIAEFQREQVAIIRRHSDAPITHNSNRNFLLDNELLLRDLDFASFDNYPDCDHWQEMLLDYDLWRNGKAGRPFWVMETSPAHNGGLWGYHKPHRTGYLVAEAVAAYASGAEGFSHWLWRQQRAGVEQNHGAVLSAWGTPTVGYAGVLGVSAARALLEPVLLNSAPAQREVAMTYSDRARAYFITEPYDVGQYIPLARRWFDVLLAAGLPRDLLFEGAALDGYKLLTTPFVPYLSPEYLARARAFVEAGGLWIAGPLTGGRTGEHTVPTDAALGALEGLAGVETLYTYPLTNTGALGVAFGQAAPLTGWAATFLPTGAAAMGVLEGGVTPGLAFITEHQVGKGKLVLLGALPEGEDGAALLAAMFRHYAAEAGVAPALETSSGTIALPRTDDTGLFWVVVNMDGWGGTAALPAPAVDLLNREQFPAGTLELAAYGWRAIRMV